MDAPELARPDHGILTDQPYARESKSCAQSTFSGKNVVLKYTPKLTFKLDRSLAEGDRVLSMLDDLERQNDNVVPDNNGDEQAEDDS